MHVCMHFYTLFMFMTAARLGSRPTLPKAERPPGALKANAYIVTLTPKVCRIIAFLWVLGHYFIYFGGFRYYKIRCRVLGGFLGSAFLLGRDFAEGFCSSNTAFADMYRA